MNVSVVGVLFGKMYPRSGGDFLFRFSRLDLPSLVDLVSLNAKNEIKNWFKELFTKGVCLAERSEASEAKIAA